MNLQGKIQKLEKEKRKLLKEFERFTKESNEQELFNFMLSGEYSKFYNFVNNKYSCKSPEWNERLTSCDKYIGLLKKIENIANFQTIFNKKHEENENGYKVGDVFYSSWGYEQTNIDFYQVIATSKKTIWVAEIKANAHYESWNSGKKSPIKNSFTFDKKVFKTLSNSPKIREENGHVESIYKYNGCPKYFSNDY
ncbi:hypothetical protein L8W41_06840 [Campylobacter sp. IFREMER_LSEM_CL1904]|uniref:hypothetical protein n=1 Tax=Campylobacter TaxID=194 RepID=UPI00127A3442|nr:MULTISPECIES: hypothetical protein [Campylobacter]MBT0826919.1 hypothetical protein [Campylobacter lari]MBT0832042.1 hypothetical protein [Campylobacter lari]MCV3349103.1 hypothetical protein [Campylobacter sp. RKI_CA19_01127]MCV3428441.1 hypothetical protein [Campylobacter sp. IFREMER_LSEM_CL1904]